MDEIEHASWILTILYYNEFAFNVFSYEKRFEAPFLPPNPKVHLPNGIFIANHHLYADFCHRCSSIPA